MAHGIARVVVDGLAAARLEQALPLLESEGRLDGGIRTAGLAAGREQGDQRAVRGRHLILVAQLPGASAQPLTQVYAVQCRRRRLTTTVACVWTAATFRTAA